MSGLTSAAVAVRLGRGLERGDTTRSGYDNAAAVMVTLADVGIDHDDAAEKPMLAAARCSGGDEDDPA
ncbi:hypothetical protein [Pseudonocardia alaniniphila]|uniref:Uncharacterized protein n=1 Tax=Pseudonocardia alaniniphila TaxID=75291 RepID=A0ABS9TCK2_9PSEU|nr:hypothetical protein [Pseudonocardia alaniniphila]MCH6166270.1 hypothetical protein [Pseudonocardia alaniniphila]